MQHTLFLHLTICLIGSAWLGEELALGAPCVPAAVSGAGPVTPYYEQSIFHIPSCQPSRFVAAALL